MADLAATSTAARTASSPARRRPWVATVARWVVVVIVLVLVLFTIYWMIVTSLKIPRDIYRTPSLWPRALTLGNYDILINQKGFLANIGNSIIVSLTVTVTATSREQLDNLYRALSSHPMVKVVL